MVRVGLGAGLFGLAAGLALASPTFAAETTLGMSIASTAATAETTVEKPAAIRPAVRDDVRQLIITLGPKPSAVLDAIDLVFDSCRPAGGVPIDGWRCPATEEAYSALRDIRGVVVALLESPAPAAIGDGGPAALSSFPTTVTGGTAYTAPE